MLRSCPRGAGLQTRAEPLHGFEGEYCQLCKGSFCAVAKFMKRWKRNRRCYCSIKCDFLPDNMEELRRVLACDRALHVNVNRTYNTCNIYRWFSNAAWLQSAWSPVEDSPFFVNLETKQRCNVVERSVFYTPLGWRKRFAANCNADS